MSGNRPLEPSMPMVRRMGELDPQRLVGEVMRLRKERDALRGSLVMKLAAHVSTIDLRPDTVLLVRKHGRLEREAAAEVLAALADRLRQRYSWDGAILLLDGKDAVVAATPADAARLAEKLRAAEAE